MTSKTKKIILITSAIVLIVGISAFLIKKNKKPNSILLLGGLDNRDDDLSIDEQANLIKKGSNMKTEAFRFNNSEGLIKAINETKKPSYVVLFSKGGEYSIEIAQAMKSKDIPLEYLYIVEPYGKSSATKKSVNDAVKLGVPSTNVFVGLLESTGFKIVDDASLSPSCVPFHWCALKEVGKLISLK